MHVAAVRVPRYGLGWLSVILTVLGTSPADERIGGLHGMDREFFDGATVGRI
jgi:hypothetical protein